MQPPNVPVESYQIVGSLQIGVFFNLILLGAVVVQAAAYFRRCRRDSLIFKILVALVLTLEIVHSICASLSIYYFTVIIADISDPRKPRSSYFLASVAVIEPLSTALVQGFFCFRIYRLSGNIYTTGLTGLFSGFRVSTGLFLGYRAFRDVPLEPAFLVFQHEWDWLLTAAFVVGALADLTIACTLCYHVNKLASPLVMKTYIRRGVEWDILAFIADRPRLGNSPDLFSDDGGYLRVLFCVTWIGMYIVLAKLYSNALLSSLNARYSYRRMMNVDAGSETSVNSQEISVTRLRRNTHPGVIEL
ncbi:hypothetical protein IW261DRAFT_1562114 [Armillaria novae-zelandiae]|uniref:DUF6534 domain-containing protein n=1 Tax=Armillaria novae-zelandiae TaxID=153914 RepID=A0AA39UAS1_9AGAR|nr:hypothetical protein IW261DRAFT_1562114 [Armillaria novae-zelandiae]